MVPGSGTAAGYRLDPNASSADCPRGVNAPFMSVFQIDEDTNLVPEAIQGGTYGFNSANVPAEGFQF